jgi:serine/threonine-protein kinase
VDALGEGPEAYEDLEPGARLGRYEVVGLLGRGGFGAVYEATHRELRKRVALKVLHREFALHPTIRARFAREAVAASGLRHPHVVDVTDVGVSEGQPYLVMEFLEGETLRARCAREGALPVAEALDALLPIVDAVAAAHDRGIVHRDLKPDNVFLARVGPRAEVVPKVLDFGIVKISGEMPDRRGTLTGSGALLGTPAYMSPEQAQNLREVDGRSDQFSLGAILYECATGRRAFEGEGMIDVLHRVAMEPVTPPRALRPELPAGFEAALLRALEKSPADRFGSARELGAALLPFASARAQEHWAQVFARPAGPPPPSPPTDPTPARASAGPPSREVDPHTLSRDERPPSRGARWPALAATAAALAALLAGADALQERRARPVALPAPVAPPAPVALAQPAPPPPAPAPVPVAAPTPAPAPAPAPAVVVVVAPPRRAPVVRRAEARTADDAGAPAPADAGVRRRVFGPNGAVIED